MNGGVLLRYQDALGGDAHPTRLDVTRPLPEQATRRGSAPHYQPPYPDIGLLWSGVFFSHHLSPQCFFFPQGAVQLSARFCVTPSAPGGDASALVE